MRSYSLLTTISLLGALVASTFVVSSASLTSSTRRELMLGNVDVVVNGEIGALFGGNERDGLIASAAKEEGYSLAEAVQKTSTAKNRLRNGSKGSGKGDLWSKSSKSKGFGKGSWGKDCKKRKDYKSKGKGKGDKTSKSKGGSKGDQVPTSEPSEAPSEYPTESSNPTESFYPTYTWCDTMEPSSSAYPTELTDSSDSDDSGSSSDSVSDDSGSSSDSDSDISGSSSGSSSSDDRAITGTATESGDAQSPLEGTTPGFEPDEISSGSLCKLLNANYDNNNQIMIWDPDNTDNNLVKEGAAAVKNVVATPIDATETEEFSVTVSFDVIKDDVNIVTVGEAMDNTITRPVALALIGCQGEARQIALEEYMANNGRKLQSDDETFVVMENWSCIDNDSDCTGTCEVGCTTALNYKGDLEFSTLNSRLELIYEEYFQLLDDVYNWYPQQEILSRDITVTEVDNSGSNANAATELDTQQSRQGTRAAPFIGAATGMLAVLLLMILAARRRKYRDDEQVSHLKLDESDDTYFDDEDRDSLKHNNEYNTRDTHIVGEGDSVISHWTGYTGRGPKPKHENYEVSYNDGLTRGLSDVHKCSSATCHDCDVEHEKGVNFIKTGASALPVRTHSLPSDASREYTAEDTVEL